MLENQGKGKGSDACVETIKERGLCDGGFSNIVL